MYKIVKSDSLQKLEIEVQRYLKNGWSVSGGVTIVPESGYLQVVVNSMKIDLHKKRRS